MASMKAQMEEQLSRMSQPVGDVRRDANKVRQNEERLERELAGSTRRGVEARQAVEAKALEKKWCPVASDVGLATVEA
eukprot:14848977-Alexandrium_andersonii.AAC.1